MLPQRFLHQQSPSSTQNPLFASHHALVTGEEHWGVPVAASTYLHDPVGATVPPIINSLFTESCGGAASFAEAFLGGAFFTSAFLETVFEDADFLATAFFIAFLGATFFTGLFFVAFFFAIATLHSYAGLLGLYWALPPELITVSDNVLAK
jgi:hypothetical protein